MSTMSLRDTIVPKSDQLNYDDLVGGRRLRLRVTGLAAGASAEQPVRVQVVDAATGAKTRDYVPCKSMRRVLVAAWGDRGADWVGKIVEVFGDPTVTWAGAAVGGIRISAVSGIAEPLVLAVSSARGKRARVTIAPIADEAKK